MTGQAARLFGRHIAQAKRMRSNERWADYSRLKLEWIQKHPEASSRDIDKAARAIAARLGL